MQYFKLLCISILILFTLPFCTQSCDKKSHAQRMETIVDTSVVVRPNPVDTASVPDNNVPTPDPTSKLMKFEVVFSSEPADVKATVAKLKYNKSGWVSVEWDDNSLASIEGYSVLKNKYYTDGCSNNIPYTGAVAVIGMNQYLCNEVAANDKGSLNYDQMKELIGAGWDIENHSYYHDPTGNCNNGSDWFKNIKELDELIKNRIGYKMNGAVVPTNYSGFATAAKDYGYVFSTSQGTFDGLLPAGNPTWKPTNDFDLAPKEYSAYGRIFHDGWADMENDVKTAINELVKHQNHYFRFASHGIDKGAFERIVDYFQNQTNDKYLFLTTREIMEYRLVSSLPIKYTKEGNKLIVEIDTSTLPERIRWRDLSFVITNSGAKISSINVISGLEKASFNANTGLVNVFKQIKEWK